MVTVKVLLRPTYNDMKACKGRRDKGLLKNLALDRSNQFHASAVLLTLE